MIDLTTVTLVDYAIIFVLVTSAVFSTMRGMTREALGLLGWVVSIVVANYAKPSLEDPIADLLDAQGFSVALAWVLPFAAAVIIWFFLANLLSPGLTRVGLGSLDRWIGVIFGVARGYLLVLIAFVGAVISFEGEYKLPATIQNAHSTPLLSHSVRYVASLMPENYGDKLSSSLVNHKGKNATAVEAIENMIESGVDILKKPLELLNDESTN